jgi:hypothetical protein
VTTASTIAADRAGSTGRAHSGGILAIVLVSYLMIALIAHTQRSTRHGATAGVPGGR